MSEVLLELEHEGRVGRIILNRPQVRNAFNELLIEQLTQAFQDLGAREQVRVIVLAAHGAAFCAGADLNWMRRMAEYSYDENMNDALRLAQMLQTIATCPKPTIAMVQGDVYAGGLGLVAACDMAAAVSTACFCVSEVKLGLVPATISPYLIRAMGVRNAQRYWLTAERFTASQARAMGLISEVVDVEKNGSLQATVDALCQQLLLVSPQAVGQTKRLIDSVAHQKIDQELIHHTAQQIALARAAPSGRAGVQAFLGKQTPPWVA